MLFGAFLVGCAPVVGAAFPPGWREAAVSVMSAAQLRRCVSPGGHDAASRLLDLQARCCVVLRVNASLLAGGARDMGGDQSSQLEA